MIISQPELLSGAIDAIYESVADSSQWQIAIERLRVMFNASTACLVRSGPDLQPGDAINSNPDPEFQLRYIEEHAPYPNIYAEALQAASVGSVYSDHSLVGADALHRSRFWNEWLAPQDMYGGLGCKLLALGPSFWIFDIQRGRNQDAFDANEAKLLDLIAPHLRRATELSRRLQSSQTLAFGYANLPFGVLFADSQLRVTHLNDVAEAILMKPGSAMRLKAGVLNTADLKMTAALQALVADACGLGSNPAGTGGDLLLRGEAGDVVVTISPAAGREMLQFPHARQAVIHLRVLTLALPDHFEDQARRLFDLTPAEARLAAALASGVSLKDAAVHQGIKFSTARSYLESIFRKTRTRQQSQLVALLKST
jgi:DNA-binding CsgD family transcriptional regulator